MSVRGRTLAVALPVMGAAGLLSGSGESVPVVGNIAPISEAAAAPKYPKVLGLCIGQYVDPETDRLSGAALFPGARDLDGRFPWRKAPKVFRGVRVDAGALQGTYKVSVNGGSYVHLQSFGAEQVQRGITRMDRRGATCTRPGGVPDNGMPNPDRAIVRPGGKVVIDTNSDNILVTPDEEVAFWPSCVENNTVNKVGGTVVFAAGARIIGWRANVKGYGINASLLGPHVADTDAFFPADTSAGQVVAPLQGAEISQRSGSDVRVTAIISKDIGGTVVPQAFSLRADVDEICGSNDSGGRSGGEEVDEGVDPPEATIDPRTLVPAGF